MISLTNWLKFKMKLIIKYIIKIISLINNPKSQLLKNYNKHILIK
jgi:hypothetical protein